jgi:galactokinase
MTVRALAPGRVNLIGDHTDYTGGMVLPMTIDRWTEVRGERADRVELRSDDEPEVAALDLRIGDPQSVTPSWARYVAGVVAELRPSVGIRGSVTTDIPIGAGLSSSAALELAVALALGFEGGNVELAQLCRRAEVRASGVPCGIMDQLVIASGIRDHAVLIDCGELTVVPVRIPDEVQIVVQFVEHRTLAGSAYADRVAECAAAEALIGPLRTAQPADAETIADPIVRARARHVISENRRVRDFAEAISHGDLAAAGELMVASHESLRSDYETSTAAMDAAVRSLREMSGVYGARMTGGGFGGCVVAMTRPGALADGWVVRPVDGAHLLDDSA